MKKIALMIAVAVLSLCSQKSFSQDFPGTGKLSVGCNYWSSASGIKMWSQWDEAVVDKDFADLSANGVSVMRVFPLWPDFQPLTAAYGYAGGFREWLQADGPLQNPDCVDEQMMGHFRTLCDLAAKYDIKLVVGLVTGWMSGRLYVPAALDEKNIISDPVSRMWQVRFVRHFVREMKDHAAIAAWDLGNECNCMDDSSREENWTWMYEISSAIRLEDTSRPVVSGMHPMQDEWNLYMQGELTDVLTTHPYPLFTAYMNKDSFNTMRNGLHAAGQSLLYAGVSGRPCFVEEAGDLGRSVVSEERSAAYVRNALFTSWANGLGSFMWWCSFDFDNQDYPPYTWTALECELGLMDSSRRVKPTLKEMKSFKDFMDSFEYADLPARQVDAVCLVSQNNDYWPASFGAFALSRQAGFDIKFTPAEAPLPDADFYIVPAVNAQDPYQRAAWNHIFEKVRDGATLLMTKSSMMVPHFEELTGNRVEYSHEGGRTLSFTLPGYPGSTINASCPSTVKITSTGSRVIAQAADGEPVMTVSAFGKGKVIYVNAPLEVSAVTGDGAFYGDNINPLYLAYREAAKLAGVKRKVVKPAECAGVGLTEHKLADGKTLVVAINYDPEAVEMPLSVKPSKVLRGEFDGGKLSIPANDAAIFIVR